MKKNESGAGFAAAETLRVEMRMKMPAMVAGMALTAVLGIFGCGSGSKQAAAAAEAEAPKVVIPDLIRAANCTVSTMQNPKERFHVSMLRKDDDKPEAFVSEADFTPDSVDGTSNWRQQPDGPKLSAARSNTNAWDESVMLLAAPLTTAGVSDMRMVQTTVISVGDDSVGGYDTVKYLFDTARLAPAEKARFAGLIHAQDFSVVGAAWVAKDTGCLMKYTSDYNWTAKDGTMGSVHSEAILAKQ